MLELWEQTCRRASVSVECPIFEIYEQLVQVYNHPERSYHNTEHVLACLRELETVVPKPAEKSLIEWAIWFHDAVYDARRDDNEERSAEWARIQLARFRLSGRTLDVVAEMILDTKHQSQPKTYAGRLLCDIDLSILGKPAARFEAYERAIRKEYSWVSDKDYVAGRKKVLELFLNRNRIYWTESFFDQYEEQARINLNRAWKALEHLVY